MPGSLPFFAVWFEAKSGQSLQVVCFDPGLQILFLRHHKVADIGLLDWVMFSGVLLPVYPCKYPSVWVGERSDSRVGNAALSKRVEFPPTLPWNVKHQIKRIHMWHVRFNWCFRFQQGKRFQFRFFFCLVNLFTLEQSFVVVKIRHSSLILKEVLHMPC